MITPASLTDREIVIFGSNFAASRWNSLSDMAITGAVRSHLEAVVGKGERHERRAARESVRLH